MTTDYNHANLERDFNALGLAERQGGPPPAQQPQQNWQNNSNRYQRDSNHYGQGGQQSGFGSGQGHFNNSNKQGGGGSGGSGGFMNGTYMSMESTDWREAAKQRAALAAAMMQQPGQFPQGPGMPMGMPQFAGHPPPPFPFMPETGFFGYNQNPQGFMGGNGQSANSQNHQGQSQGAHAPTNMQGGGSHRGGSGGFNRSYNNNSSNYSGNYSNRNNNYSNRNNSQQNNRHGGNSGNGNAAAHSSHGWTVPLPRDERLENELFSAETHSSSGIHFDRYEDIPVQTSGGPNNQCPAPIDRFEDMNLAQILIENIALMHYGRPTPVQKFATPIIGAGLDVMACAQTGSGKTAAFLMPILNSMLQEGPGESLHHASHRCQFPMALILAPTRELATQIHEEARKFSYRSALRSVVVYGGSDYNSQFRELSRGCQILVATPGRLIDILDRDRVSLRYLRHFVLDEADRMLDMGFEPQIRDIVSRFDMPDKWHRQTLMFSATFPKEVQKLAQDFLREYVFLGVGRVGSTSDTISQTVLLVEEDQKLPVLEDLIRSSAITDQNTNMPTYPLTLVFVETKRSADYIGRVLYQTGYPVISIHGDKSQPERELALDNFRHAKFPILIATSVAARGLDIPNVRHVINFDLPGDIDEYVHRIGRTGRVGNEGQATSLFVTDKNKNIVSELVTLLEEARQQVPNWLSQFARDARRMQPNNRRNQKNRFFGGFGGRDWRSGAVRTQHQGAVSSSNASYRSGGPAMGGPQGGNMGVQGGRPATGGMPSNRNGGVPSNEGGQVQDWWSAG